MNGALSVMHSLAAQNAAGGVTIGEAVLLAGISAAVAVGVAWGLLRGKVSDLDDAATAATADRNALRNQVHSLETKIAGLEPVVAEHSRSAERISGEIAAMEGRLGGLIADKLDGLRRELQAGGHLPKA